MRTGISYTICPSFSFYLTTLVSEYVGYNHCMILDHIENLKLANDDQDYIFDAQMTLARLSQGLFQLYKSVSEAEEMVRKKAMKENVVLAYSGGVLENLPMEILSCEFQWYVVSLYNYVRLAAWLSSRDTSFTKEYVKRVVPPKVLQYRHKIAAHYAMTAPRKDDNDADLVASLMTTVMYAHGYLRAGAISEVLTDENGNEIRATNKTSWSLTKTHNALRSRYWPDGPLKAYQSIRVSAKTKRTFSVDWED